MRVAYLSQGKLLVSDGQAAPVHVESPFGQQVIERTLQVHQRHAWKTEGRGGMFQGSMLWGQSGIDPTQLHVEILAVTRGPTADEITYALQSDQVGGLFTYDLRGHSELRHFHKNEFRAEDLDRRRGDGTVACSLILTTGTANIGITNADGRSVRAVTEGDSVDRAPSWAPGPARVLLYQSAGAGRDAQGFIAGLGPFGLEELNLDSGRLTTLRQDPDTDFLQPRRDAAGDLYFIRRPYEAPGARHASPRTVLLDIVLFPYRLLRAFFHFLNTFSLFFSGKPLTMAGGPTPVPGREIRHLVLWGRWVEVEKLARRPRADDEPRALVPATWELVRAKADGREERLASHVVAYDLAADGSVVYTNGTAVFRLATDGTRSLVCRDTVIERVAALD